MKFLTKSLTKFFIKFKNLLQFEDFVRSTNASAKSESIFQNFLDKRSEFHRKFSNKDVFQKMLKIEIESTFRFKSLVKQIFFHSILLTNDDSIISDDERNVAEKNVAEKNVAERNVEERDVKKNVKNKFIISLNHQSKESFEAKNNQKNKIKLTTNFFRKDVKLLSVSLINQIVSLINQIVLKNFVLSETLMLKKVIILIKKKIVLKKKKNVLLIVSNKLLQ